MHGKMFIGRVVGVDGARPCNVWQVQDRLLLAVGADVTTLLHPCFLVANFVLDGVRAILVGTTSVSNELLLWHTTRQTPRL
jgi:hypothetical protein